jgi:hypothetical protein
VQVEHGEHDAEQVDQDPDGVEHVVPVRSLQHNTGDRIRKSCMTVFKSMRTLGL